MAWCRNSVTWGSCLIRFAVAAALLLPVSPAFAQWTGKGQLGVILETGNGDSLNANARAEVKRTIDDWQHRLAASVIYEADEGDTSSQSWEVEGDSRYSFNPRDFWFGGFRYQNDRFSGFRYQATIAVGIGRRYIDSDRTKLTGHFGIGLKSTETRDAIDPATQLLVPGAKTDSVAAVGGLDWEHKVSDTTTVYNKFAFEAAQQNNFVRNEIGVSVAMTSRLALAVAYTVRYNTDPPVVYDKTETLLTANIVYEVK
jgi:putative salt-induced outer membrane protein